jgi:hypothetical protein
MKWPETQKPCNTIQGFEIQQINIFLYRNILYTEDIFVSWESWKDMYPSDEITYMKKVFKGK